VFDSIEGAVSFALRMQRQVLTCEGGQSADRTIRFRVGINIGDVIADGMSMELTCLATALMWQSG
jgi:class 3 adenylate cyclase